MESEIIPLEVIPAWAREEGLTRCFFYTGNSMTPTFREGHVLYVAPEARAVTEGDVVVFPASTGESLIVHRIVGHTRGGWITRGDNNGDVDAAPVPPAQLVGRVAVAEDAQGRAPVRGGALGLRWARRVRRRRWLRHALSAALSPLYWTLCRARGLRRLLRRLAGPRLRLLRLRGPHGPRVKVLLGWRVIARWHAGQPQAVIRKPFHLLVLPEQLPSPGVSRSPALRPADEAEADA